MGEIKSTLDLVMEKTKHLTLSKEEKETLDVEEVLKRVPGIVQRFLDGAIKEHEFREEIKKCASVDREKVKKEFVRQLARKFTFDDKRNDDEVLRGLEVVAGRENTPVVERVAALIDEYYRRKSELEEKGKESFMKELEKLGIAGSAIVPRAKLKKEDLESLEDLKAECIQQISSLVR